MKEILEALAWPHITLIFSVIFVILFREQIESFLLRLRSVGKDGFVTDNDISQQNQPDDNFDILQHIEIEKSQLLTEVEAIIIEDLISKNLEHESNSSKVLIRNLAIAQIRLDHEQTYDSIFGSQIYLLKKLNEASGTGKTEDYLASFYNSVKDKNEGTFRDWELSHYLRYISNRGLITKNDNWHITQKGQDFLVWLVKAGKQENKAL